jgi:hypothetical protein
VSLRLVRFLLRRRKRQLERLGFDRQHSYELDRIIAALEALGC